MKQWSERSSKLLAMYGAKDPSQLCLSSSFSDVIPPKFWKSQTLLIFYAIILNIRYATTIQNRCKKSLYLYSYSLKRENHSTSCHCFASVRTNKKHDNIINLCWNFSAPKYWNVCAHEFPYCMHTEYYSHIPSHIFCCCMLHTKCDF